MEDAKVKELLTTVKADKNIQREDLDTQLSNYIKQPLIWCACMLVLMSYLDNLK